MIILLNLVILALRTLQSLIAYNMAVTAAQGCPLRALFCIYYLDSFISLIPLLNKLLPFLDRESLCSFYLPPRLLPILKLLLIYSV
jgi:hypothetical protein